MARKALLLGSQTHGLRGVATDVALVGKALRGHGFRVETVVGVEATRAGILAAWRRLNDDVAAGDAVVVYYSGHGGLADHPSWRADGSTPTPRYAQFIVPVDIDLSTDDDFRGILDLELDALLTELCDRAPNAALLLDCCHAARMTRRGWRPRALSEVWKRGLAKHAAAVAERPTHMAFDAGHVSSAVRLVAAARNQSAYEYDSEAHGPIGFFTEALVAALMEAGDAPLSWAELGRWARERVMAKTSQQRPEMAGPTRRFLFESQERPASGALAFFFAGGLFDRRPALRGGWLHGVAPGDVYEIMPMGSMAPAQGRRLGLAEVAAVQAGVAHLDLRASVNPPPGAPAFAVRRAHRPRAVAIRGESCPELARAIAACPHLIAAEEAVDAPLAAQARVRGCVIDILDLEGNPAAYPAADVGKSVENLTRIARAQALRALPSGEGAYALTEPFELSWGRVVDGRQSPLADCGAEIWPGERIYVQFHNRSERRLYVNIVDIGVSARIYILNRGQLSGMETAPGEVYCLGRQGKAMTGLPMAWPRSVPPLRPSLETLLVVVSDRPQDLTTLEAEGVQRQAHGASTLQARINQIQWAGARSAPSPTRADVRYAVRAIDFLLHPKAGGSATTD